MFSTAASEWNSSVEPPKEEFWANRRGKNGANADMEEG